MIKMINLSNIFASKNRSFAFLPKPDEAEEATKKIQKNVEIFYNPFQS